MHGHAVVLIRQPKPQRVPALIYATGGSKHRTAGIPSAETCKRLHNVSTAYMVRSYCMQQTLATETVCFQLYYNGAAALADQHRSMPLC